MTKCEKRFLAFSMVMGGVLFVPQSAYAMHIMEGYLPPAYCAAWGALCLPFLAAGVVRLRRTVQAQRKALRCWRCPARLFLSSRRSSSRPSQAAAAT